MKLVLPIVSSPNRRWVSSALEKDLTVRALDLIHGVSTQLLRSMGSARKCAATVWHIMFSSTHHSEE